jgi:hypothetical protein
MRVRRAAVEAVEAVDLGLLLDTQVLHGPTHAYALGMA